MNDATDMPEDKQGDGPVGAAAEPPFQLAESPSHLLHRAQQFAAELFAGLYDKHVTLRQFAVLAAVRDQKGATQADLVRATGIDRSTLAEMIGRMEKKGFLVREKSNADGRAKSVKLTSRGRKRLSDATPHVRAADRAIFDALPKPKRRALLDILQALAPAIDAAHEIEAPRRKKDKPSKAAGAVTPARAPGKGRARAKSKT